MHLDEAVFRGGVGILRQGLDGLPGPVCVWARRDGRIILCGFNQVAFDDTGGKISGLLGADARQLYADQPHVADWMGRCLDEQRSIRRRVDYTMVTTRQRRDVDTAFIPLDADTLLVFSYDLSALNAAERELGQREALYRETFEHAAVGIVHVGDQGRILRANPRFCQMVGRTPDELERLTMLDLTHPADLEATGESVRATREDRTPALSMEKRYVRPDGTVVWVRVTGSMHRGEEEYMVSFVEDITERKQLEERILQSQRLEAVGRLTGGIAHDFNNMLAVINGYSAELLDADDLPPGLRGFVEEINAAGERATSVTQQLLAFSRRQIMRPRPLDLNARVAHMEGVLRRIVGENVALRIELCREAPEVMADADHLDQVMLNLAVNAREAMPGGGGLSIETRCDAPYVILRFRDTGHGMDEETAAHIFEPFFTTRRQGSGLGLSTVHGIVHQHGGDIRVASAPGEGATFTITLPLCSPSASFPREAARPKPRAGETILVVEDEESVRRLVSFQLRSAGYHVVEAASPRKAIEVARSTGVDVLVTDVVMPGSSGPQVAQDIRSVHPEVSVVYMSGYTTDHSLIRDASGNRSLFLQKPFRRDQLLEMVRIALESRSSAS